VNAPGNGYVAMFNLSGSLIANLISQGPLNSPWGMAIAPANFGLFAGALLVGNFGGGAEGEDPGTLYITGGIGGGPNNDPVESHGLLASIQAAPSFAATGIQNGASFTAGPIAPNSWVAIKGNGMSATTGTWQVTGSTLPTAINGVGVTLNGTAVPVSFMSNTQVNFLESAPTTPSS
jgi:hypothetical protein